MRSVREVSVSYAYFCIFHGRFDFDFAIYLHAADTQGKADTQVVTVGPFNREDGVGDEEEDAKRQNSNTDPASDLDSLRSI
jgi:hypothetical protein